MKVREQDIELIKRFLTEKVSPYLVILFGSAAEGKMREDSDIDIAFLSEKKFSDYDIFMTAQALADLLKRDVDLVDLHKASTVFQAQIVGKGKVIFCSDDYKRMVFAMTVFKKYARLNEERRPVLDRIKERGRVYGE